MFNILFNIQDKKSAKECAKQLKLLRQKDERLNRDLLQAQNNLGSAQSRYKNSKKDELYKKKGNNWVATWNCLPGALMAPYQDAKSKFIKLVN